MRMKDFSMYDNTPTVNVVIIDVWHKIEDRFRGYHTGIVSVKRTDNNGWALPGGYQERPEHIKDAAKREVLEETGIDLSNADLQLYHATTTPDGRNNLIFWIARISDRDWLKYEENFIPNEEVSEIELKTKPWETPFSIHTDIIKEYQEWYW